VPVSAGAAAPDTGPTPTRIDFGPALHLSRGRWLADIGSGLQFITGSTTAGFVARDPVQSFNVSVYVGFAASPRGDRVIAYPSRADQGVPVLDPAALNVAFRLDGVTDIQGAAFSGEGDTLYLVTSNQTGDPPELVAVASTSGATLARVALPLRAGMPHQAVALTPDPDRPLIYITGSFTGSWATTVEVVNRATFAPVAWLRSPVSRLDLHAGCYDPAYASVLGAGRQLFAICYGAYDPSIPEVLRIDLIP
jgi:hypothetical protein